MRAASVWIVLLVQVACGAPPPPASPLSNTDVEGPGVPGAVPTVTIGWPSNDPRSARAYFRDRVCECAVQAHGARTCATRIIDQQSAWDTAYVRRTHLALPTSTLHDRRVAMQFDRCASQAVARGN